MVAFFFLLLLLQYLKRRYDTKVVELQVPRQSLMRDEEAFDFATDDFVRRKDVENVRRIFRLV
jgi:hypothetical protein